jgi:hypothetical protein
MPMGKRAEWFIAEGLLRRSILFQKDRGNETTQDPSMTDLPTLLPALLAGFLLFAFLYACHRGCSLADLSGPKPSSFWLGKFTNFMAWLWISD